MEHNHDFLRTILKRYMNGESTRQEEAVLKEAFASRKGFPPDIEEMRPMVQFFSRDGQSQPQADFTAHLISVLHEVEEDTSLAASAPSKMPTSRAKVLPNTLRYWMIRGVAAAVVMFVITQVFRPSSQAPAQQLTASAVVTSPEQAYAVVEQALYLVSGTLHKERKRAASEVKRIRQATSILHSPQQ
jgi:hypothetical protein